MSTKKILINCLTVGIMGGNSTSEQEFLTRLSEILETNVENEHFGVSELAKEMGMSRSNLHRKIITASKISANQYIRQFRLQKALEMLKQTSFTVSEVSYKVGFSSPAYFIKCFHDYYGYSPGKAETEKEERKNKKFYIPGYFKRRKLIYSILVIVVLTSATFISYSYIKKFRYQEFVYNELLPKMWQINIQTDYSKTYDIWETFISMQEALNKMPNDTNVIHAFYSRTKPLTILSEPSGANVYAKSYSPSDTVWRLLGQTPLNDFRFPWGINCIQIKKEGFEKCEDVLTNMWTKASQNVFSYQLLESGKDEENMVFVSKDSVTPNLNQIQEYPRQWIGNFYMDKFEVTNELYREFVENGGYRIPKYWKHPFIKNRNQLSFDEAMNLFKSKTGDFQPLNWIAGTYPVGEANKPVTGLSWYEAAAYAEYAGKSLPTIYHWSAIIDRELIPFQLGFSNINKNNNIARIGDFQSLGRYGTYDIIGNAREWIYNDLNDERFVFGASANDPTFYVVEAYSANPWNRDNFTGFRCVKYVSDSNRINLEQEFKYEIVDWSESEPVSEELFSYFIKDLTYEHKKIDIVNFHNVKFREWEKQIIYVDVPYENPDLDISIYLPNNTFPPFQSVIIFPGIDAEDDPVEKIDNYVSSHGGYLLQSGRAVILPHYFDTYGRGKNQVTRTEASIRRIIDIQRTIDYLQTRPDMDTSKIAYYGISWGGSHSPAILSVDKRFDLGMVNCFGANGNNEPKYHAKHYLNRIKIPMLMQSGKYDYAFPYETKQKYYYNWLGTPRDDKKWIIYETTHAVPHEEGSNEIIMWLDKYFGKAINK